MAWLKRLLFGGWSNRRLRSVRRALARLWSFDFHYAATAVPVADKWRDWGRCPRVARLRRLEAWLRERVEREG